MGVPHLLQFGLVLAVLWAWRRNLGDELPFALWSSVWLLLGSVIFTAAAMGEGGGNDARALLVTATVLQGVALLPLFVAALGCFPGKPAGRASRTDD